MVLPAPFSPRIPIISPFSILKEHSLTAYKFSYFLLKNDLIAPLIPGLLLKSLKDLVSSLTSMKDLYKNYI